MSLVAPHGEHDWHSSQYVDEWVRNDVTRDAERQPKLRRAAALLPFNRHCAIEVVDIGGGYGELTRQVLEEFPNSSVVMHDFSEPMIVVARQRLAAGLLAVQAGRCGGVQRRLANRLVIAAQQPVGIMAPRVSEALGRENRRCGRVLIEEQGFLTYSDMTGTHSNSGDGVGF